MEPDGKEENDEERPGRLAYRRLPASSFFLIGGAKSASRIPSGQSRLLLASGEQQPRLAGRGAQMAMGAVSKESPRRGWSKRGFKAPQRSFKDP